MRMYLLSIDWLQVRCSGKLTHFTQKYKIERLPKPSKYFEVVFQVVKDNEVLITGQAKPKFDCGTKDLVLLKVQNRFLYVANPRTLLNDFCEDAGLTIHAITRLDICADFVNFANNLAPTTFISRFARNLIRVRGKFKFAIFGHTGAKLDLQTLTIGRLESPFFFRLYNKSRELQDRKDKPYIRNTWNRLHNPQGRDVWRLEVKCTDNALTYFDNATGETINLANVDYTRHEVLQHVFAVFLRDKYRFFKPSGKSRTDREKQVVLFNTPPTSWEPLPPTHESDTTKMNRVFLRMLYDLDKEMRTYKREEFDPIVTDIIANYASEHNLHEYLCKLDSRPNKPHYS